MTNIKEKIRKLLALARDAGATEAEADTAMTMATALMTKFGIEHVDEPSEVDRSNLYYAGVGKRVKPFVLQCSMAASVLNAVIVYYTESVVYIVGGEVQRTAAREMFDYLFGQIEQQYKVNLKLRGRMSQKERANYRRTFKYACAVRLAQRARMIVDGMKADNNRAMESTGSTALVVADYFSTQLDKANDHLKSIGINLRAKTTRTRTGHGTRDGIRAGDTVNIQPQVQ